MRFTGRFRFDLVFTFVHVTLFLFVSKGYAFGPQKSQFTYLGRVSNDGEPVKNVEMTLYDGNRLWSGKTDQFGQYRISANTTGRCLLILTAPGFRSTGIILDRDERHDFELLRLDQKPSAVLRTREDILDHGQRTILARELLQPMWERLQDNPRNMTLRAMTLENLAQVDPQQAYDFIESNPLHPQLDGIILGRVAEVLARQDLQSAMDVVGQISEPRVRSSVLLGMYSELWQQKEITESERSEILDQVLLSAKAIKAPAFRIAILGLVAEKLQ